MKIAVKRALLIAAAVSLCLSLSGCVTLDSLRQTCGIYLNDEKTIIELDGKRYLKLPPNEYLNPLTDFQSYYISDADVPLLLRREMYNLKEQYSCAYERSVDKNIMIYLDYMDGNGAKYCEESKYDELLERMNQPFEAECIGYVGIHSNKKQKIFETLSPKQQAVITATLKNVTPQSKQIDEFDHLITLFESSADGLFRRQLTTLYFVGENLYLCFDESSDCYQIPEEYQTLFDPLAEALSYD